MLLVISPAKTLDYTTPPTTEVFTRPDFLDHSQQLIDVLRPKSPAEIASLMDISDPLAVLKHLRATGVNSIGQQAWTRRQVSDFIARYQHEFGGEQGVRLTYHPLFVVARPKP